MFVYFFLIDFIVELVYYISNAFRGKNNVGLLWASWPWWKACWYSNCPGRNGCFHTIDAFVWNITIFRKIKLVIFCSWECSLLDVYIGNRVPSIKTATRIFPYAFRTPSWMWSTLKKVLVELLGVSYIKYKYLVFGSL